MRRRIQSHPPSDRRRGTVQAAAAEARAPAMATAEPGASARDPADRSAVSKATVSNATVSKATERRDSLASSVPPARSSDTSPWRDRRSSGPPGASMSPASEGGFSFGPWHAVAIVGALTVGVLIGRSSSPETQPPDVTVRTTALPVVTSPTSPGSSSAQSPAPKTTGQLQPTGQHSAAQQPSALQVEPSPGLLRGTPTGVWPSPTGNRSAPPPTAQPPTTQPTPRPPAPRPPAPLPPAPQPPPPSGSSFVPNDI
jgi:hypothetical protein